MGRAWGASQGDFWACSVNAGSWCVLTLPKAGFVTCFPTPAAFAYQARVLESVVSRGGRRPVCIGDLGPQARERGEPAHGGVGHLGRCRSPARLSSEVEVAAGRHVSWWVEAGAGPLEERTPMLAMPGLG